MREHIKHGYTFHKGHVYQGEFPYCSDIAICGQDQSLIWDGCTCKDCLNFARYCPVCEDFALLIELGE